MVANGLANEVLTARTEFSNDRYDVVMECVAMPFHLQNWLQRHVMQRVRPLLLLYRYPIKTCNFNNRDWFFQPDTGPVLFPNLEVPLDQASALQFAYCVVQLPTSAAPQTVPDSNEIRIGS